MIKKCFKHPWFFWVVLTLPSIPMTFALSRGVDPESLLHPTGEFSARFMIIAMMLSPLLLLFRNMNWPASWLHWLVVRRRALGVAAFAYALIHTILYVLDVRQLQEVIAEFWALGIWTGWLAFFIFIPLALSSNQASVIALGSQWKALQRGVYFAAVFTLLHWIFVHNNLGPALVHFLPLALLEGYRIFHVLKDRKQHEGLESHE